VSFKCGHPRTPENTVLVRGKYEYCRMCNRQRANLRYRLLNPGAPQKAFLSLDDKLNAFLAKSRSHWIWGGQMRDDSTAVCAFENGLVFVAQLLWERQNGEVPQGHCLYRTCHIGRCVRPECRLLLHRGAHITDALRGVRNRPRRTPQRYIYGMSPEAAAMFGLIDDEQYMSRYKLEKRCG
jgi:hypothetical protein